MKIIAKHKEVTDTNISVVLRNPSYPGYQNPIYCNNGCTSRKKKKSSLIEIYSISRSGYSGEYLVSLRCYRCKGATKVGVMVNCVTYYGVRLNLRDTSHIYIPEVDLTYE